MFSSGAVALGRAGTTSTAATLADQQMEVYRAMPYDAIGLDTSDVSMPSTYSSDTGVCPANQTPACGNTAPVNNATPNTGTWSCAASPPNGTTSVITDFSANGINPCTPHRQVTGPDGRSYAVDTYIKWGTLVAGERPTKQVSVVVRKGTSTTELAKIVSVFDCATGSIPGAVC